MRILCVCRGNTCRSPMAQGTLQRRLPDMRIDSAGTHVRGAGGPADPRGLAAASARGYDNTAHRARQLARSDFRENDLILALDSANLADLHRACPPDATCKIRLFDPQGRDIPDPYDGGPADYEHALDMIEHAANALIEMVKK